MAAWFYAKSNDVGRRRRVVRSVDGLVSSMRRRRRRRKVDVSTHTHTHTHKLTLIEKEWAMGAEGRETKGTGAERSGGGGSTDAKH